MMYFPNILEVFKIIPTEQNKEILYAPLSFGD